MVVFLVQKTRHQIHQAFRFEAWILNRSNTHVRPFGTIGKTQVANQLHPILKVILSDKSLNVRQSSGITSGKTGTTHTQLHGDLLHAFSLNRTSNDPYRINPYTIKVN
jgi:hypothetical protein